MTHTYSLVLSDCAVGGDTQITRLLRWERITIPLVTGVSFPPLVTTNTTEEGRRKKSSFHGGGAERGIGSHPTTRLIETRRLLSRGWKETTRLSQILR